jgi:hypothetical protein
LKTIYDEDWAVCSEVIKALGKLADTKSMEVMKRFYRHKRVYIRNFA